MAANDKQVSVSIDLGSVTEEQFDAITVTIGDSEPKSIEVVLQEHAGLCQLVDALQAMLYAMTDVDDWVKAGYPEQAALDFRRQWEARETKVWNDGSER